MLDGRSCFVTWDSTRKENGIFLGIIVEEVDNMVDLFCRHSVVGSLSCVIMYPLEKQKHLTLSKVSYFSTWVLVRL